MRCHFTKLRSLDISIFGTIYPTLASQITPKIGIGKCGKRLQLRNLRIRTNRIPNPEKNTTFSSFPFCLFPTARMRVSVCVYLFSESHTRNVGVLLFFSPLVLRALPTLWVEECTRLPINNFPCCAEMILSLLFFLDTARRRRSVNDWNSLTEIDFICAIWRPYRARYRVLIPTLFSLYIVVRWSTVGFEGSLV